MSNSYNVFGRNFWMNIENLGESDKRQFPIIGISDIPRQVKLLKCFFLLLGMVILYRTFSLIILNNHRFMLCCRLIPSQ